MDAEPRRSKPYTLARRGSLCRRCGVRWPQYRGYCRRCGREAGVYNINTRQADAGRLRRQQRTGDATTQIDRVLAAVHAGADTSLVVADWTGLPVCRCATLLWKLTKAGTLVRAARIECGWGRLISVFRLATTEGRNPGTDTPPPSAPARVTWPRTRVIDGVEYDIMFDGT